MHKVALVLACLAIGIGGSVQITANQVKLPRASTQYALKSLATLLLSCKDLTAGFQIAVHGCRSDRQLIRAPACLLSVSTVSEPNFERFASYASGKWKGVSYSWGQTAAMILGDSMELKVTPGFVSKPQPCTAEVVREEGASGLKEKSSEGEGEVKETEARLDCASDDFTFFDDGSWCNCPTKLSNEFLDSNIDAFGLTAVIAHADDSRRYLALVLLDGKVSAAYVAVQGREMPPVAELLLSGRLQCVVEANAWPGGAESVTLTGIAPAGQPWSSKGELIWAAKTGKVKGGENLLPPRDGNICFLPGGLWVEIFDDEDGKRGIRVGSLSADAGEMKVLGNYYKKSEDGMSHLLSRSLQEVVASDDVGI